MICATSLIKSVNPEKDYGEISAAWQAIIAPKFIPISIALSITTRFWNYATSTPLVKAIDVDAEPSSKVDDKLCPRKSTA